MIPTCSGHILHDVVHAEHTTKSEKGEDQGFFVIDRRLVALLQLESSVILLTGRGRQVKSEPGHEEFVECPAAGHQDLDRVALGPTLDGCGVNRLCQLHGDVLDRCTQQILDLVSLKLLKLNDYSSIL